MTFFGTVQANAGYQGATYFTGAPGTIYLQTATQSTLLITPNNINSLYATNILSDNVTSLAVDVVIAESPVVLGLVPNQPNINNNYAVPFSLNVTNLISTSALGMINITTNSSMTVQGTIFSCAVNVSQYGLLTIFNPSLNAHVLATARTDIPSALNVYLTISEFFECIDSTKRRNTCWCN